jgi:hypothetical protein
MHRRLAHHEEQERAMSRHPLAFLMLALFGLLPVAQAGELGRLFYTPQERRQLEYQEARTGVSGGGRGYIIVNGVVQRQGGKRTVWINGVPQDAGRANDETPASVSISVPGKSHPVQTQVGKRIPLDQPAPDGNK